MNPYVKEIYNAKLKSADNAVGYMGDLTESIGMEKSILDGIKSGQYHLSGVTMPMIYETSEYLQNRGLPTAPSHTIDESLARETDDSESKKFRKFGVMIRDAYVPWDIIDALRPGNPYSNQ